MKKYNSLFFFSFMQIIYIIATAMCFYLLLYKGTQVFVLLVLLIIAGGITSYCLFKTIKNEMKFNFN